MNNLFRASFVAGCLVVVAGCASVPVFREPDKLPRNDGGYLIRAFAERQPRHVVAVDYSGCVEEGAISSVGLTGKTGIVGSFALRPIIEREFSLATDLNFSPVAPGKKPGIIIYVEVEKLLVMKSWSTCTAELVMDIEIVSLKNVASPRRVFRKKYTMKETSEESVGGETVPTCVYACVQKAVQRFLEEAVVADYSKDNAN